MTRINHSILFKLYTHTNYDLCTPADLLYEIDIFYYKVHC
jgi:hypothetical protein